MSASPQPAPSRTAFGPLDRHAAAVSAAHPAGPAVAALPRLLGAWHLLSLDAPAVAAVWVLFVARCAGIALPWTEPAAMFVAVWILYAADRLLDARGNSPPHDDRDLEQRHWFHHQHRQGFYAGLAVACSALGALLLHAPPSELRLDVLLGSVLLAWLLVIHLRSRFWARPPRLPKEFAVGIFFAAAIFIPVVPRVPGLRPLLLPDAFLFAAVCTLNCLYIYAWEHPHDRSHAHASTRWALQWLPQLTAATVVAASTVTALFCSGSLFSRAGMGSLALPALACAGGAALLLLLQRNRAFLSPLTLRAAADLCLLTPALLLPAFRLARHA